MTTPSPLTSRTPPACIGLADLARRAGMSGKKTLRILLHNGVRVIRSSPKGRGIVILWADLQAALPSLVNSILMTESLRRTEEEHQANLERIAAGARNR